jgi:two-component system phosphate regulon sensor histidine kinase PhoR
MLESGKAPLKMASSPLLQIVQNSIDRLLPQAKRKNLTITTDISPEITVLVDETMIGRVITNLLHNAIKFTENGGVTISARPGNGHHTQNDEEPEGQWVTVSVADTGVGIPSSELPRIFERFYKVDRARKREGAGTGLGLAIARHIVEAHGGHIWAESNGAGATFYFTLPAEELVESHYPIRG